MTDHDSGEPELHLADSVHELPWFTKVAEDAEAYLATVPDDQKSAWYLRHLAGQAEQPEQPPAGGAALTVEQERDALAAKLAAISVACRKMARGVGYRVSGDHDTWDSWHEGKCDFAGEIEDIIDTDAAQLLAQVRGAAVENAATQLENSPFDEHLLQRHQKLAAARWLRDDIARRGEPRGAAARVG